MSLLRHLVLVQFFFFVLGPPAAIAVLLDNIRWALLVIPWGLYCAFLFGWAQGRGLLVYKQAKYLPIIQIGAADRVHVTMLAVNVSSLILLLLSAYMRGYL